MNRPIDPDLDGFPDTRMATPNELRKMLHDAIRRGAEEKTENRRLRKATQWQPIATVPLRTEVLLYWPAKMGRTLRPAQKTVGQVNNLCHYAGATYWMPLPNHPENRELCQPGGADNTTGPGGG